MTYIASAMLVKQKIKNKITGRVELTEKIIEEIPAPPLKYLVIEGGGVRGIVYAGAIKILELSGILNEVEQVAGSSAGAITAMLVALGYKTSEIEDILKSLSFHDFLESVKPWYITPEFIVKGKQYYNIYYNDGHSVSSGKKLLEWLQQLVEKKLNKKDATFADLAAKLKDNPELKLLHVTGSDVTLNRILVFDVENTPQLAIAEAVLMSASYPGLFSTVKYDKSKHCIAKGISADELDGVLEKEIDSDHHIILDGGIINNLPSFIFHMRTYLKNLTDYPNTFDFNDAGGNPAVLNLKVDTKEEMEQVLWSKPIKKTISSFFEHSKSVLYGMASRDEELSQQYSLNTIQIDDCGIDTLQLDITEQQKQLLIDSGCNATWEWVQNHLSEAYQIKSYDSEQEWLDNKSMEEIAAIINIYKDMWKNEQEVNEPFAAQLLQKIDFLKKYLNYRCQKLLDQTLAFNENFTPHIDISPKKPRERIDQMNRQILKCLIHTIDKQIKFNESKINSIRQELDLKHTVTLHDPIVFDQIAYLTGLEEIIKATKIDRAEKASRLELCEHTNYSATDIVSAKIDYMHRELRSYNKKAFSKSAHANLSKLIDDHFTQRIIQINSANHVNLKFDLASLQDLKIYIMSLMLYLNFIKCDDRFIQTIIDFYQHLFGPQKIPTTIADIGKILRLNSIDVFTVAYRIETLMKTFITYDGYKLTSTNNQINLDAVLWSISNPLILNTKGKSKRKPEEEDLGIELNYMYQVKVQDKVSIYERLKAAHLSVWKPKCSQENFNIPKSNFMNLRK